MIQTLNVDTQINLVRNGHKKVKIESEKMERILEIVKARHRNLYDLLDTNLINDKDRMDLHCDEMSKITGHSDFDDESDGGRGRAYRENQKKFPLVRKIGDEKILSLMEDCPAGLSMKAKVLDIIGGNGTTARVTNQIRPAIELQPYIISADPNWQMVRDCLNNGLPAIWQSAQSSLFKTGVLDCVLGTRGLHHVPRISRLEMVKEAYRTLKPGGKIILVDVEVGSPSAKWYSEAIDRYSTTGHRFDHFTVSEFDNLLKESEFKNVKVERLYDPFVFEGESYLDARNSLLSFLVNLFGLVTLRKFPDETEIEYWDRVHFTLEPYATFNGADIAFDPTAVNRFVINQLGPNKWQAVYPRVILCATGYK